MSKRLRDPYVNVSVAGAIIASTFVLRNEHLFVPVAHTAAKFLFIVKDDVVGAQVTGAVGILVQQLYSGSKFEGTFPITEPNDQNMETG